MGWFITLFTWGVPEMTSNCVLDIFFLKGRNSSKLIFEMALALLDCERDQIMQKNDMQDLLYYFNQDNQAKLKELSDCRKVLNLLKYYNVDQADIDFYREVCRG